MNESKTAMLPAFPLDKLEEPTPEKLYRFITEHTKRMVEAKREVKGVLILLSTDGMVSMIPAFELGMSEDMTAALHEVLSCDPQFVACAFVYEAWMSRCDKDEDMASRPPPSEDPDREEAVVCVIKTAGRVASMQSVIDRDTGTIEVMPFHWNDEPNMPVATGRFIDRTTGA